MGKKGYCSSTTAPASFPGTSKKSENPGDEDAIVHA